MKHDVYEGEGMGIDESMVQAIVAVLQGMKRQHTDVLWVMPDTKLAQELKPTHLEALKPYCEIFYPPKEHRGNPSFIRFHRDDLGTRYLSFPGQREWKTPTAYDMGRWFMPSGQVLRDTVTTLEAEYNTPVLWSPGHMGLEVLRDIHTEQKRVIEPLPDWQQKEFLVLARQMPNWVIWSKWTDGKPGLSAEQKRKRRIAGFDKNGQFLGASASVTLGNGAFVPSFGFGEEVGFWHYKLLDVSHSAFNGIDLPCPLDRREGIASTALLDTCLNMGLLLEIREGVIWQEEDRYLNRWAREMWQHRQNMRAVQDVAIRLNCSGTAKMIPNSMVGRFAHEASKEYYHPDWNRQIIHQAVVSQTYTLNRIYRQFGLTPVLVSKDALYFVTDEEDFRQVIPGFLAHEHEQRGFKPLGMAVMNEDIVELFARGKVTEIEAYLSSAMRGTVQSG